MPTFAYSGRTRGGETVTGERVADTMDAAVAALRREQIMVTRIDPAKAEPPEGAAKRPKAACRCRPRTSRSSRASSRS
jgi:type II secretory pathway component PulF